MTTKKQLPRGFRVFSVAGRTKPHVFQWLVNGTRNQKFFGTKEARDAYARIAIQNARTAGMPALAFDEKAVREWTEFRAQVSAPLAEVIECWRRFGPRVSPTVADAVKDFLAAKKSEGISGDALLHYKTWLARLSEFCGTREAGSITRGDIAAWIESLKFGDVTNRGHFVRARTLFAWLLNTGVLRATPFIGARAPKTKERPVELYTLDQGRSLFAKNESQPRELLGRMALEAFAGLRFSSATRLVPGDINFAERGIVLPAASIKTERRQFIDGLPENLWAWLEWAKPGEWTMTPRQYLEAKSNARIRADLPEVRNALRHSFCSYHIAAHKDPNRTSVILCHSSPRTLWRHYRGNATAADGVAWFGILPPARIN